MPDRNNIKFWSLLKAAREAEIKGYEDSLFERLQDCLTFDRAQAIALDPTVALPEEVEHLQQCRRCRRLVENFRIESHPQPIIPISPELGTSSEKDDSAVRNHLPGSVLPFHSKPAARIERVIKEGIAAGGSLSPQLEKGRRFLARGRHGFRVEGEGRQAWIEVEERELRLLVRFVSGTPLQVTGTSEPLGTAWKVIEPDDPSAEAALLHHLEWSE